MSFKISRRTAQQIVNTVKDVCGYNINFIEPNGIITASTDPERVGNYHEIGHKAAQSGRSIEVEENDAFYGTNKGVNLPFSFHGEVIAVIGISGAPDEVRKYAFLAQKITNLLLREQELDARTRNARQEAGYFVRSLVHGPMLNHDYYVEFLRRMNIDEEEKHRTILVSLNPRYNPANLTMAEQEIRRVFLHTGSELIYFEFPNEYVLILSDRSYQKHVERFRRLADEFAEVLQLGVGSSQMLNRQSRSYDQALIALKALESHENYGEYDKLNIEILLGSVPEDIKKNFSQKVIGELDAKELEYLQAYFNADCSLKKTAEKLCIHKNTLQYQLDRIRKDSGLDPRSFKDAAALYLGMKVK